VPDEITDKILEDAQGVQTASGGGSSVSRFPLTQQIEADKYLASKAAGASPSFGLRFAKVVHSGAV
jgi:hypothetical protein